MNNTIISYIRCGKKGKIFQVDGDFWLPFAGKIRYKMPSLGATADSSTSKKVSNRNPFLFWYKDNNILWLVINRPM